MRRRIAALLACVLFCAAWLAPASLAAADSGAQGLPCETSQGESQDTPQGLPCDVGNHNDYGGGDYGGGDYGGGYDYGGNDYDYDYDSGFSGGGGGGGRSSVGSIIVSVIIVIGIVIVVTYTNKRKASRPTRAGGSVPAAISAIPDNTAQITAAIQQGDPLFSPDRFLGWVKEVFITLQQAWTARDWSLIRPFEKEELFCQHEQQLQEYINLGRINVIERINVNQSYLYQYVRESEYEYLTVYLTARMGDYIIDEKTRAVLKGDPNREYQMRYLLTFMRKTGVLTDPANSNHSTVSCPHCGAPTKVTSSGKCEYCDYIITTGEHDWVLSNLDSIKPGTNYGPGGVFIR